MEEEFDKVQVSDPSMCGDDHDEIDLDYEFDAPRFFDFTRPETFWDADEAQQWFEFAASYPPSRKYILGKPNLLVIVMFV